MPGACSACRSTATGRLVQRRQEFAAKQAKLAKAPKATAPKLRDLPDDDELEAIAY